MNQLIKEKQKEKITINYDEIFRLIKSRYNLKSNEEIGKFLGCSSNHISLIRRNLHQKISYSIKRLMYFEFKVSWDYLQGKGGEIFLDQKFQSQRKGERRKLESRRNNPRRKKDRRIVNRRKNARRNKDRRKIGY